MAIEKIPTHPWAITNHPTVYDEEAMTVLELVGRSDGKVNECVEAFNELKADTDRHLDAQDTTITNRLRGHDIRLNTFESTTIPGEVQRQLQENINNGTFNNAINVHAGDLEAQVNNLLATIRPGEAPLDPEITDARRGYQNTIFDTLGDAMRFQAQAHNEDIDFVRDCLRTFDGKTVTINRKLLFEKGSISKNSAGTAYVFSESNTYVRTKMIKLPPSSVSLSFDRTTYKAWLSYCDSTGAPVNSATQGGGVYVTMQRIDAAAINPAEVDCYMKETYNLPVMDTTMREDGVIVDSGNYADRLPDANNVDGPCLVRMLFDSGSNDIPANLPFSSWPGGIGLLMCSAADSGKYQTQLMFTNEGACFRYNGAPGDFSAWVNLNRVGGGGTNTYRVTSGGSIVAGVKTCYERGYSRMVVEAGTYDLLEDYKANFGEDYFDLYNGYGSAVTTDPFARGLWLENIEVVFAPGAVIQANYTGPNSKVKDYFAPIACGDNVIIDGLVLKASGLRYGIHPDFFGYGDNRTTLVIRNCDLYHKRGDSCKAIGAGFGVHTDMLVENTIFRSDNNSCVFSIHNNSSSNACSNLRVVNCYIAGAGYFEFNSYAASTQMSTVMVNGCSYYTLPKVGYETNQFNIKNVEMLAFHNEKRSTP